MVKSFKILLLQNLGCLGAESVHKSLGTGDLPRLLKRLSYIDIQHFYGKVKFASLCICMNICMGKLLRISDHFSSEATEPNLLKFYVEPP